MSTPARTFGAADVAQVSKPAVSPISKSANRTTLCDRQVWKLAIGSLASARIRQSLSRLPRPIKSAHLEVRATYTRQRVSPGSRLEIFFMLFVLSAVEKFWPTRADYGYGLGFCGGRISGFILSSCAGNGAGDGDGRTPVRTGFGLGGIFSNSSIKLTLSRSSMMVNPCSSILREFASVADSVCPIFCSKKTRVSAIRSSRTDNFRSNGARKLRISWICLRISSNVFCILIYKKQFHRSPSLFRCIGQ